MCTGVLEMPTCTYIAHRDHKNTIRMYFVTVETHVIAMKAGQSSQGTFELITPVISMNMSL